MHRRRTTDRAVWDRLLRCVFLIVALAVGGCSETVCESLPIGHADEVLLALLEGDVDARRIREEDDGRWRIEVPVAQRLRALSVLGAAGLPRPLPPKRDSLASGGWLSTAAQQHQQHLARVEAELESTLLRMDGVIDVRVHVVLPQPGEPATPRASVLLRAWQGQGAADDGVQRLLSGALPGLAATDVAVVRMVVPRREAPALRVTTVGPFVVVPESAFLLRAALLTLLSALVGTSMACAGLAGLRRHPARQVDVARSEQADAEVTTTTAAVAAPTPESAP